jgi:hypothetical protein
VLKNQGRLYFITTARKPDGSHATLKLHRLLNVRPDGLQVDQEKHGYLDLPKAELR